MKKVAARYTTSMSRDDDNIGNQIDIEGLFQNMGLGQLCNLNEPTYPELVRQFIASTYVSRPDDSHQEGFLAFVVHKVYFEVSFTHSRTIWIECGEKTSGLYWTS
ncbi:hypothetical protein Bca52824_048312 [Brassica carinata]|uniref:Uncharacterized protein n=1 Tax=Brassica carinata TaxID=52824 RepID=A0A8X7RKQ4_BRACI|nr:hypothetical protein Bca52824_048312 [Brassica carinata]